MPLELKVYDNGDHTCLVWLPSDRKPIANCRGFAIRRLCNGTESFLHGFVGFCDSEKLDLAAPWKFPVQRYLWWDYGVHPGDKAQYSVMPVTGTKDKLVLDKENATPLTDAMEITGQCTPHLSAYFNRGIVSAQWVSRALAATPRGAKIASFINKPGDQLRNALSGLLRPQILNLLTKAKADNAPIYAALYELNDPELVEALTGLGNNCHLILANGAFGPDKPDENAEVRKQLHGKVDLHDRMVSNGHFAHNKFVVFCDKDGKPQRVLTGSTNWTVTGLCTQANNGLNIDDPGVAQNFLDSWKRLLAAKNAYTDDLVAGNDKATTFNVDGCSITPWFVKTSKAQDMVQARKLIASAKDGILFLFFNPGKFAEDPGKETLLQTIIARHDPKGPNYDPDLYICGVVNQDIDHLTKDPTDAPPVTLYSNGKDLTQTLGQAVLVPHNIKDQFHDWVAELMNVGVHVHSKVIVIDPFGEHPVLMTGSHNLGFKASNANDDNLVIVEGNGPLAASYAVNIVATFQTYRWNNYVEEHRKDPHVWHGLVDNDEWQAGYLTGESCRELEFWMGKHAGEAEPPHKPKSTTSKTEKKATA